MIILLFMGFALYQDIVGEWAAPGECNSKRLVFTYDKKMEIKSFISERWWTIYDGVYEVEGDVVQGGPPNACLDFAFQVTHIDHDKFEYCTLEIPETTWDCSPMYYEKCR